MKFGIIASMIAFSQIASASTYNCRVKVGQNKQNADFTFDTTRSNSSLARLSSSATSPSYVEMNWDAGKAQVSILLEDESREVIERITPSVLSNTKLKSFKYEIESEDPSLSMSVQCFLFN